MRSLLIILLFACSLSLEAKQSEWTTVSLLGRFFMNGFAVLCLQALASESLRENLSPNAGWKFHLGDDWPNALPLNKADPTAGAARPPTSTSSTLKLP